MAKYYSNNKQIYSYTYCASFDELYCRMTLFNINLELFENIKPSKSVLGAMEKYSIREVEHKHRLT